MKRTFLSRLSGAVVALAVGTTTLAAVGAATPAGAATTVNCTTTTKVAAYYSKLTYGDRNTVQAAVTATCPGVGSGRPDGGTLTLSWSKDGGRTWAPATTSQTGYVSYDYVASGLTYFRAEYGGGSETVGSTTLQYAPASPVTTSVAVVRDVALTSKKVRAGKPIPVTWKANPGATGIVYAKKPGKKKFKVYKRVAVRATGTKFKIKLPTGTRLRFVIPGSSAIPTWQFQTRIKRTAF